MSGTTPTTSARPSLRSDQIRSSLRTGAVALAVLLLEATLAAGLVNDRFSRLLLLFAAVIGIAAIFRFPMAAAVTLLGFTDFIFLPEFLTFPVGSIDVRLYELVVAGLLLVALVQPQRRTWGGAAGGFLAVFLLLVVVSGVEAVSSGRAEPSDVLAWGRPLGLLTFFYVVVRLLPSREERRTLLLGASIIAALTGVVALLVSLGWSFGEVLEGDGTQVVREEEGVGGVQRVRLAGLSLGYALFWYVATQIVLTDGARRLGWGVLLGGIALDIVVSFNRNMWLGLVVGLLLMLLVAGPRVRGRFAIAIAIGVTGIAAITAIGGSGEDRLLDPVVTRASTILSPGEVTRESSLQDRQDETSLAWEFARDNPALGVGAGAPFGVYTYERAGTYSLVRTPQLFLHNQYLYLVLVSGVGGLIAFLGFLGTPLLTAARRSPRDPTLTACAVGIAMIMVSSVVAIYFTVENMTTVLALLAGIIVADAVDEAPEAADDPPPDGG